MGKSGGTETCASPKATGTRPAAVAERSTAGSGLDVTGTLVVVGTRVWELVHTARINAATTAATAPSLRTLFMVSRSISSLTPSLYTGTALTETPSTSTLLPIGSVSLTDKWSPYPGSAQTTSEGMTRVSATNTTTMAVS